MIIIKKFKIIVIFRSHCLPCKINTLFIIFIFKFNGLLFKKLLQLWQILIVKYYWIPFLKVFIEWCDTIICNMFGKSVWHTLIIYSFVTSSSMKFKYKNHIGIAYYLLNLFAHTSQFIDGLSNILDFVTCKLWNLSVSTDI